MKELLNNRLGRIAMKVLIWGLAAFVISSAGTGLLVLVMNIARSESMMAAFGFFYGIFWFLSFVSFYLLASSMIILLVITIVMYSKRFF